MLSREWTVDRNKWTVEYSRSDVRSDRDDRADRRAEVEGIIKKVILPSLICIMDVGPGYFFITLSSGWIFRFIMWSDGFKHHSPCSPFRLTRVIPRAFIRLKLSLIRLPSDLQIKSYKYTETSWRFKSLSIEIKFYGIYGEIFLLTKLKLVAAVGSPYSSKSCAHP